MTRHVDFQLLPPPLLRAAIDDIPGKDSAGWDRYANPFEQKETWRDKHELPAGIEAIVGWLESPDMVKQLGWRFDARLRVDAARHYHGLFLYSEGDHLSVHVDAGIHPLTGERKHATAVVYLTDGAPLEFWQGTSGALDEPILQGSPLTVPVTPGRVVFFENNDWAWHGVPAQGPGEPRAVVTLSYVSDEVDRWQNKRQRAYFVPRPDEVWTPEVYALRDKRADPEKYAEVYRA